MTRLMTSWSCVIVCFDGCHWHLLRLLRDFHEIWHRVWIAGDTKCNTLITLYSKQLKHGIGMGCSALNKYHSGNDILLYCIGKKHYSLTMYTCVIVSDSLFRREFKWIDEIWPVECKGVQSLVINIKAGSMCLNSMVKKKANWMQQ